ncbi:hypothetical protein CPAV1605_903 [seawater metagenome]|uniref:Uncharacterized protein n=1 Tax=seawater metagenome TaxID=1561972 RepID=A0A5E8CIH4_9ZZZZ
MLNCREYSTCELEDINYLTKKYLYRIGKAMVPKGLGPFGILYFIIRLIQLLGILFIILGIFLPKDFCQYHIIWCLFNLFFWLILKKKSFFSYILKYIFYLPEYPEFIPTNMDNTIKIVFIILFISLINFSYPKHSIYNLLGNTRQYMNRFN